LSPGQAHGSTVATSQPSARPICSKFTLEETQSLLDAPRINGSGRYERRCRSISVTLPLCANGRNKHHERHEAPTTLQHYKECNKDNERRTAAAILNTRMPPPPSKGNGIQRSHEQIAPYNPSVSSRPSLPLRPIVPTRLASRPEACGPLVEHAWARAD
jgi:hypothetical protein